MDECIATNLYDNLPFCPGKTTLPGIRKRVYFIPKAFILAFPEIAEGKYSGNFTLAEECFFKYIEVVVPKSKFTATSQGEAPCKTFRQHLEMMHPVLDEKFADFQMNANNDDMIYIVQESKGKYKVVGCEEYPTDTSFSDDSGSAATDTSGSTITVECDAPTGLLIYEGEILTGTGEDANENS